MITYRISIKAVSYNNSGVSASFYEGRRWNLNHIYNQADRGTYGTRTIQDGLLHIARKIKKRSHEDL